MIFKKKTAMDKYYVKSGIPKILVIASAAIAVMFGIYIVTLAYKSIDKGVFEINKSVVEKNTVIVPKQIKTFDSQYVYLFATKPSWIEITKTNERETYFLQQGQVILIFMNKKAKLSINNARFVQVSFDGKEFHKLTIYKNFLFNIGFNRLKAYVSN